MHWGSIEIDIEIAKCFEELLKLLLILQNPLPNIDVFSISKNSVSHIPAFQAHFVIENIGGIVPFFKILLSSHLSVNTASIHEM